MIKTLTAAAVLFLDLVGYAMAQGPAAAPMAAPA